MYLPYEHTYTNSKQDVNKSKPMANEKIEHS